MKSLLQRAGMPLLICVLWSGLAPADAQSERRSIVVSLAGIDLNADEGRAIAFRRLKIAAKQACIDVESRRNLSKAILYVQCVNEALTTAIAQVRQPTFQEYAVQRLGIEQETISTASR